MNRYYWTHPKAGGYLIQDRTLKLYIARVEYRENAVLITSALNGYESVRFNSQELADATPISHATDPIPFARRERPD